MLWTALVRTTKRISKTSKSSCRTRIHNYICTRSGRLAQLVQSTCLTSRGSGVRIPHRPQLKKRKKAIHESGWLFSFSRSSEVYFGETGGNEKSQTLRSSGWLSFSFQLGTRAPVKGSFAARRKIFKYFFYSLHCYLSFLNFDHSSKISKKKPFE